MKSNELRIGSWVETYDCEQNQLLIEDFALMYERNLDADEYCKPIPLTEEWLVKFGFEITRWGYKLMGLTLVHEMELGGVWTVKRGRTTLRLIEHIHQLQNLYLALTGEELKELEDGS